MGFVVTEETDVRLLLKIARQYKVWLVLIYHRVDNSRSEYTIPIDTFQQNMEAVSTSGLTIATVKDVIRRLMPQSK